MLLLLLPKPVDAAGVEDAGAPKVNPLLAGLSADAGAPKVNVPLGVVAPDAAAEVVGEAAAESAGLGAPNEKVEAGLLSGAGLLLLPKVNPEEAGAGLGASVAV